MSRMFTGAGILTAILAPALAFAAYDDVSLATTVALDINGIEVDVSSSAAVIESITVDDTSFSFVLQTGSSIEVTAPNNNRLIADTSSDTVTSTCNSSSSVLKYVGSASRTVTITPSSTLCSSNAGAGQGSSVPPPQTPPSPPSSGGGGSIAETPAASAVQQPAATPATTTAIPASGLSSGQIQSILDVLASFDADTATIANVRASLEGTTTGSVTSAAVAAFKANLTVGSLGSEVKALQQFLNAHGYAVAAKGAGSPGNETTRFGPATKAALIKFQKAKGITPSSGYFGAKTRAAVNAEQ